MEEMTELLESIRTLLEGRQLAALRHLLGERMAQDIAELFPDFSEEERLLIYRLLPKETAAEVLVELSSEDRRALVAAFSDYELSRVLDEMYADDAAELLDEMPANFVRRILRNCTPEMRRSVNRILSYPEGSAGSMMTTEYVRLSPTMTVGEALDHIRAVELDSETVYTCYVTDGGRMLRGIVTARMLLISPLDRVIGELMEENVISCGTHDDREAVARLFDKYNFLALPVTDGDGRLVGIITVDDAIEVISEEVEEDFAKMAAIVPTDRPYLRESPFSIFLTRIPWLLLLMLGATFTGLIITSFEEALAASVVLTAFIPMLMGTGGNSGSQASVTVIRGLSLGEITYRNTLAVAFKELCVSLLCGLSLGAVNFGKMLLVDGLLLGNAAVTTMVALAVSLALAVTVVLAKLIGGLLPLLVGRIGLDPAVMAGPFITTLVDALSLLVYFALASALLGL